MSSHTAAIARRSTRAKIRYVPRFRTKYQAATTAAAQITTNNSRPIKPTSSDGLRTRRIINPSLRCARFLELHLQRQKTKQILQRQNAYEPISLHHEQPGSPAAMHLCERIDCIHAGAHAVLGCTARGNRAHRLATPLLPWQLRHFARRDAPSDLSVIDDGEHSIVVLVKIVLHEVGD